MVPVEGRFSTASPVTIATLDRRRNRNLVSAASLGRFPDRRFGHSGYRAASG